MHLEVNIFHCFTGIHAGGNGYKTLRMRPSMIFQTYHADIFLNALEETLKENA